MNGNSRITHKADDIALGMSTTNGREHKLQHDGVSHHVGDETDRMISDVVEGLNTMNKLEESNAHRIHVTEKSHYDEGKSSKTAESLLEKQFIYRNSVLTDLYETKHFRSICNMLLVILINTAIYDMLRTRPSYLGIDLVIRGFAKFHIVIGIWPVMFVSTLCLYGGFYFWANQRIKIPAKSFRLKMWDCIWIQLFVVYQIALIILPAIAIVRYNLPPVSSVVVLGEQIRMKMKTIAFVRSVTPIVQSHKLHSENMKNFVFPNFTKFLYFMFAPTLIYRDSYPRTEKIRWTFVLWYLTEVVLVMFSMAFIFEHYIIPAFEEFGKYPFNVQSFLRAICGISVPSILISLSIGYCLLHAWLNAAAEVMRFGDRLFYKDWWNATTYGGYYRRWNVVVHDWLYTYIYKDMYETITARNRFASSFAVFFVSSVFHEYIAALILGIFFPVMFLMFGVIGFLLIFLVRTRSVFGNTFLWFTLCTGSGLMISLYSMEYFARVNCPPYKDGILDLFLPRSFYCFLNR